jgi:hypothetical protein
MSHERDRLFNLLPVVYRQRDEERGFPLRAVLRVMADQVAIVEADIDRLYENWFIETCEDWVVPYIGDLIGYSPVHEAAETANLAGAQQQALDRILVPRRDVANTIRSRRRKGARALLEELAADVAGWPARVVEFNRLVSSTQALNHPAPRAGHTVDLGERQALDLVNSPFDLLYHMADVRRISSRRDRGRYGLANVGLFVWRLRAYSVTRSPAYLVEERSGDHCFAFSILGVNTRLFSRPVPETKPTDIAEEANLPVPIRRRGFEDPSNPAIASAAYYGEGKSLALWYLRNPEKREFELIPRERVIPADLTDWRYEPKPGFVAVDPVLGRIAFAPQHAPDEGVWVTYHYGFSADMGGGEYERPLRSGFRSVVLRVPPANESGPAAPAAGAGQVEIRVPQFYRIGQGAGADFKTITEALAAVREPQAARTDAILEIVDSEVYEEERLEISAAADQRLEIRAAPGARPVIRQLDWRAGRQDDLTIRLGSGSRVFLDGLLVSGRGLEIRALEPEGVRRQQDYGQGTSYQPPPDSEAPDSCERHVTVRHCTLVPGWALRTDCEPARPAEPSITIKNVRAHLTIEHSIVGSIQVDDTIMDADPVRVEITDSIVDATDPELEAFGAPGDRHGFAVLTVKRTTVFGRILTHAIDLAENSILDGQVEVARKQQGCIRFCYVRPGSRTPRRYHCEPESAAGTRTGEERARVERRIVPRFNSRRYGSPGYCQLADRCPTEISRGADDQSEMGAFHRLYQPQRTANLRTRLTEYVPAGVDVEIIFAS